MRKKLNRIDTLREEATKVGLWVATYSPGDGQTRYKFIKSRGGKPISYFAGNGIYTALGFKEADTFLTGYYRSRGR